MSAHPDHDAFNVTIRDENLPRTEIVEILLKLSSHRLRARDLIAERVRAECDQRLIDTMGRAANRLVQPSTKEQALNGSGAARLIDPEKQVDLALSAFENNGFILLVDDRQVETLDEEIEFQDASVVTFLKLTPLVGG